VGVVAPGRLAVGAGNDALIQGPVVRRPGLGSGVDKRTEAEGSNGKMNEVKQGEIGKMGKRIQEAKINLDSRSAGKGSLGVGDVSGMGMLPRGGGNDYCGTSAQVPYGVMRDVYVCFFPRGYPLYYCC
jgi:hypothetical protein